jgi:microcystin-dependent protein
LDLGDGATHDVQTSATDTTSGALLTPGAFGWGETGATTGLTDIDDDTEPSGAYSFDGSTTGTMPDGGAVSGTVLWQKRGASGGTQTLVNFNASGVFLRTLDGGAFGPWLRLDTPAGAVQAFAMTTVPGGWLECDGSNVSRTTYAVLFAAIGTTFGSGDGSTTFGLPDLRGEFVRGWDHGKGTDSGRVHGSTQNDAFQGHKHTFPYSSELTGGGGGYNLQGSGSTFATGGVTSDGTNGTPRISSETRPRNIALMYCIKV